MSNEMYLKENIQAYKLTIKIELESTLPNYDGIKRCLKKLIKYEEWLAKG